MLNSYPQARYTPAWSVLHCLGEEGLAHLKSPILSAYSRTPSSFQLISNMSFPMMKRSDLFWMVYVLFAPSKPSMFALLMPTSSHPLMVLCPPWPSSQLRRWLPRGVGIAMRLRTCQGTDASTRNCKGDINAFRPSIMAYLRYGRAAMLFRSIWGVQSRKPISTVLFS